MQDPGLTLAEECFREHLAASPFQQGVDRGWWGVVHSPQVAWPHALLWIAAPPRPQSPDCFNFRFLLEDYPEKGPTAIVWDLVCNARAEPAQMPKGTGDVAIVFRTDWQPALYAPWDRIAMDSHGDWAAKHPGLGWKRTYTIVHYLRLTHELLSSDEYHGV